MVSTFGGKEGGGGGEERDGGYAGRKKVRRKEWGERKGRKDGWNKSEN